MHLQVVCMWHEKLQKNKIDTITMIAGYEGIFCGLSAIYNAVGQIVNGEYGKTVLPLG